MEKLRLKHKGILLEFENQRKKNRRLWNIDDETADFLYLSILNKTPKTIMEIGSSNGFSTFWLSLAAEKVGAKFYSIESDEERLKTAKKNLQTRDNIIFCFGKAEKVIPDLDINVDFLFIDACKVDYHNYISLLNNKLNDNCLIIADNVISHRNSVKKYLELMKHSPDFTSMTLNIGAGLELSIYNKSKELYKR